MEEIRELFDDTLPEKALASSGALDKMLELLEDSTLVQAGITGTVVGAVVYLIVTGQPVPDILERLAFVVVGFWFGTKANAMASKAVRVYRLRVEGRDG